jgi:hypothetical protein
MSQWNRAFHFLVGVNTPWHVPGILGYTVHLLTVDRYLSPADRAAPLQDNIA